MRKALDKAGNQHASWFFMLIILLSVFGIIGYRYNQYVVNDNFIVNVNTSCDPTNEACFVSTCSPEEDSLCDDAPYKMISILAKDMPTCLAEHTCTDFTCSVENQNCEVTFCSSETVSEGEECTAPFL